MKSGEEQRLHLVALDFWENEKSGSKEDLFYSPGNMKRLQPSGWRDGYADLPLCEKPDVDFPPCCTSYSDYYKQVEMREKVGMGFDEEFLIADDNREYIVDRVDRQMEFLKNMDFQAPYGLEIVSPNAGVTISASFKVQVRGRDNLGIEYVEVCVGDRCMEKDSASGRDTYFQFDAADYASGTYTVTAKGFDRGGNEAVDQVRVTIQ